MTDEEKRFDRKEEARLDDMYDSHFLDAEEEQTTPLKTQQGKFEVVVKPADHRGYFEHEDYGDEWGGGLWFEGKSLIDYDGVYELPSEVIAGIRELGYIVAQEFE